MSSCKCPTCDQSISFDKLYISRDRRLAAFGNESVKLAPTEGAILYVLRSGASVASIDIRNRMTRGAMQKPFGRKLLNNWVFHLRIKLDRLGLRVITTGEGFRLMFPPVEPILYLAHGR